MARRAWLALVIVAIGAQPHLAFAQDGEGRPEPWLTGVLFPSNMAWSPDGRLFFTEKDTGNVRIVQDGALLPEPFVHLDVASGNELGLLGIALHPAFPDEPWVYVYFSSAADQRNEVMRFRADGNVATDTEFLIDGLELRGIHNGGDLAFGVDTTLFITIGEAAQPERAQIENDIGGKVLRLDANGAIPLDNPFGDSPVYSMGHRNSFGICVDPATGDVWETENGPESDDEVNRIVPGGNYGWPEQLGPGGEPPFVDPVLDFPQVIVPTGCAVWNGVLYFGAFDGIVRRLGLPPADPARDEAVADLGRGITDLAVGPDGALYIATVDTIYRMAGPPVSSIPTPAGVAPVEDDEDTTALIALVFVALAVVGLGAVRLARGRRG